jgi:Tfp pilus tip-associated adhesin PilY1
MRLAVATPRPAGAYSLDLYWLTTTDTHWGQGTAVQTVLWNQSVNTDGRFHTFAVDVAEHSTAWTGRVTALRVDLEEWPLRPIPSKVSANTWNIQYIGLASARSPA